MSADAADLRFAIAHDWLTGMRGGEKVLRRLCRLLPDAPIHTLIHVPGACSDDIDRRDIRAGVLSDLPGVRSYYRRLLPLMPPAAEWVDLGSADVVVSSSHAVAKGFGRKRPGQLHVCYCHTPMRYAWRSEEYRRGPAGAALAALGPFLRAWDRRTAGRVDLFLANSACVARRIRRFYGRSAVVLYPPVNTHWFTPADVDREDFYLLVSAIAPYKRVELAMSAFAGTGRRLRVIGTGPGLSRLRRRAPANVELPGWCDDETLRDNYRRCRAVVFPQVEDFGLVPLEAMACGTPVIAYAEGGALESVLDAGDESIAEPTGLLFTPQTPEALAAAVQRFEGSSGRFRAERLRAWAEAFSPERFDEGFVRVVGGFLRDRGFEPPPHWRGLTAPGRARPC
jgi:glycosyltransferase involved in cell wall biosynthesis